MVAEAKVSGTWHIVLYLYSLNLTLFGFKILFFITKLQFQKKP
jgi:hypothetical protein